jgi:hypothetical protein
VEGMPVVSEDSAEQIESYKTKTQVANPEDALGTFSEKFIPIKGGTESFS